MEAPATHPATVVVGVDGSSTSHDALLWAAADAARRSATLRIVHAWNPPVISSWAVAAIPPVDPTAMERAARETVLRAAAAVDEHLGDAAPTVELATAEGDPVHVLLDASRDSDLLVVGTRGHGRLVGALVGSTATGCVHESLVPVAVVRDDVPPTIDDGVVVVGFDDSPASRAALRWAIGCAAAAHGRVRVVHSWSPDLAAPFGGPSDGSPIFDLADPTPVVEGLVADLVADLHPLAPIEVEVIPAPAASGLLEEAGRASLLVVGTRGHSGLGGLLLGSVSGRCLHHSSRPVVLVPAPPNDPNHPPTPVHAIGAAP